MSNIRIRSIRIAATAAAGVLLAATAPAYATENGNTSSAGAAATMRAADASKTIQNRTRGTNSEEEVCVRGYQTGTFVRRTFCRTRSNWDRDGGIPS